MVCNVARSNTLRPQVGSAPKARAARSVGGLRVAAGMEPARSEGLGNTGAQQRMSWRAGWDLDMRRFGFRKWRSDDDEGGEQWQVIDFDALRVVALSDDRHDAELVADALEHLSLTTPAGEFDKALTHA